MIYFVSLVTVVLNYFQVLNLFWGFPIGLILIGGFKLTLSLS